MKYFYNFLKVSYFDQTASDSASRIRIHMSVDDLVFHRERST